MDKPLINILTRTSNRPKGFDKNVRCIQNQTYKNIKHIVSYDNKDDLKYITKYDNIVLIKIDRDSLIKNDNYTNPNTGKYSPHNMYFNEMIKYVYEGWVIYLDDDDYYINNNIIQKIVDKINETDDDTLLVWQFKLGNNLIIPKRFDRNNPPKLGSIDTSCVAFNVKYKNSFEWDSWKCSDYRVIKKLYNVIPKSIFINEVYVHAPTAGFGNRIDVK